MAQTLHSECEWIKFSWNAWNPHKKSLYCLQSIDILEKIIQFITKKVLSENGLNGNAVNQNRPSINLKLRVLVP